MPPFSNMLTEVFRQEEPLKLPNHDDENAVAKFENMSFQLADVREERMYLSFATYQILLFVLVCFILFLH